MSQKRSSFYKIFSVFFCLLCLISGSLQMTSFADPDEDSNGADVVNERAEVVLQTDHIGSFCAGQTFHLFLEIRGNGWVGMEANLQFDPQVLKIVSAAGITEGWSAYLNEEKLIVCSDTATDAVHGETTVCDLVLQISEDAETGNEFSFRLEQCKITDGSRNYMPETPVFVRKIAAVDSKAARLQSLDAGSFPLTPDFSPDVFQYTVSGVPAAVASLGLAYVPLTDDLTVRESGDMQLHGGKNSIYLTVDAPDGSSAVYTVTVIRAFDGSYQPSNDCALSGLSLSAGLLSPAFSPDVVSYIVYWPYELKGEMLSIDGTPRSEEALGVSKISAVVETGEEVLKVSCTAENGDTRDYTLRICMLPPYEGILPSLVGGSAPTREPEITLENGALQITSPYAHPDATFTVEWYLRDELIGEDLSLDIKEEWYGKTVRAVITGVAPFSGKCEASYQIDHAAAIRQIPISEQTMLCAAIALAVALVIGILIGRPAGKAAERKKWRRMPKPQTEATPVLNEESPALPAAADPYSAPVAADAEEVPIEDAAPGVLPGADPSVPDIASEPPTDLQENKEEEPVGQNDPMADTVEEILLNVVDDFTKTDEHEEMTIVYDDRKFYTSQIVTFDENGRPNDKAE